MCFLDTISGIYKKTRQKILSLDETRAHLSRRLAQKSGPARRRNCSTVYFPIVIEKYQNITSFFIQEQKVLAKSIGLCWDHFFGRGRAVDLFSVREFFYRVTSGFVLRTRHEVYSSILAEFRAQSQHS